MESKADAERYHRYNEPDPEMDDGGYRTPHKPIYATMAPHVGRHCCKNGFMRGPITPIVHLRVGFPQSTVLLDTRARFHDTIHTKRV